MPTFEVHTFGCKVNTYDTGLVRERLLASGFKDESVGERAQPHVHLLNTCAVTQEASREAARLARRLKARDPLCTVVVTGCAAQVDTGMFDQMPAVDLVVANSHKGDLPAILRDYFRGKDVARVSKSNIFRKEDLEAGGGVEKDHTRAFVKIQDGCNSFCSYCIIPFARGKSRSIPIVELVRRISELERQGVMEVVLTGVHIGDYRDGELKLEDLIESILSQTSVKRLRLSSLEPPEISDRLLDLFGDSRLCSHFHMSIQSACSKVLKEMKRQYSALDVEMALTKIAKKIPQAYVGMDVIVGFPGESDDEFLETFQRLQSLPWTRIHVFPYSERRGTGAARREDQITHSTRKRRAQRLRDLSFERLTLQAGRQVGKKKQALVLRSPPTDKLGSTVYKALTRDYWPVLLMQEEGRDILTQMGREAHVRVVSWQAPSPSYPEGILVARLADE